MLIPQKRGRHVAPLLQTRAWLSSVVSKQLHINFCRIESEIVDVSALSLNMLAASHHAVIMRYRCLCLICIWQVQHFAARILTLPDVEHPLW